MSKSSRVVSILIVATIVLVQIIQLLSVFNVKEVDICLPNTNDVYEYITCNGVLLDSGKTNYYSEVPLYITKILVSAGEYVNEGDIIAYYNGDISMQNYMENIDEIAVEAYTSAQKGSASFSSEILSSLGLDGYFLPQMNISSVYIEYDNNNVLRAKTSGVVDDISVKLNNFTDVNTAIYSISDKSEFYVIGAVDENNYSKVSKEQKVTITGAAFPDQNLTGYISAVSSTASTKIKGTSTVSVVQCTAFVTDGADSSLLSGASVEMKIITNEHYSPIIIPYRSILQDEQNREYIFVYNDGYLEKRFIESQVEISQGVIVSGEIFMDEYIACNINESYSDGQRVKGVVIE